MIISDRFGFAFVHIPKCAGTTVREQIARLDADRFELGGRQHHPELGRIDLMHLPLDILRDHFAEVFARLTAVPSYALTRDPHDRFRSSVSEYVKTYHHKRLSEFAAPELARALDEVMTALAARPALLPLRYVHFTPQTRYVHLDGRQVVTQRYPLEAIDAFMAEIGRRTGTSLDAESRANQDFAFRFRGSERWLWRMNAALKGVLPYGAYQGLKRRLRPLVVRDRPAPAADVLAGDEMRAFVDEIYADDIALHRADIAAATG